MRALCGFCLLSCLSAIAVASDACDSLIPESLSVQLTATYSGYRLPREEDNLPEDIKVARENSESACLGVATADFDGDGNVDYLIGLTAANGSGALIVVGLKRKVHWELHKLATWPDNRARLYVSAEPAGKFERLGGLDGPLEEGEVESLKCPNPVAVFGATESTGVAYCYVKPKWKHVYISD